MPESPPPAWDDPADTGFLQQFGRSHETTEFYSPVPDGYQRGRHKYVVVLGTVMSGLGKERGSAASGLRFRRSARTSKPPSA